MVNTYILNLRQVNNLKAIIKGYSRSVRHGERNVDEGVLRGWED